MTQTSELIDTRTGEIVPINANIEPLPNAASPLDLPTEIFTAALDRRRQNRDALMNWIREALIDGTDYGRIHNVGKNRCQLAAQGRARECSDPAHWSKPSLMKPGAEKICGMLGVSPKYPTLNDYERSAVEGRSLDQIVLRCEIEDAGGRIVAHGIGARSLSQDYGDLNKTLKMAAKSAHIDAVLRLAGLSELFTQDIEDMKQTAEPAQPKKEEEPRRSDPASLRITNMQMKRLEARIGGLKLNRERVKGWIAKKWDVQHFTEMSQQQFLELDGKLEEFRRVQNSEPITDDDRIALADFCSENGIDQTEILPASKSSIGEFNQAEARAAWMLARNKVAAKARAKPVDNAAMERSYMEREERNGRSATAGT